MKRTLSLLGGLVAGVALLLNPKTGIVPASQAATTGSDAPAAATSSSVAEATTSTVASTTSTLAPATSVETSSTTEGSTTAAAPGAVTVTGPAVESRFGPFQVQVVVEGGVLVDVVTLQEPADRKSQSINDQALPYYEEQAIETQSADLDVLTGATVTWRAYTASLEAALEEAGL
jgi:uncharacterized protein with FMN-binding domain